MRSIASSSPRRTSVTVEVSVAMGITSSVAVF
jgi:hypothetical protein